MPQKEDFQHRLEDLSDFFVTYILEVNPQIVVRLEIVGPKGLRLFFFFQAEDGIRDADVTGVQTCALPIWTKSFPSAIRSWGVSSERIVPVTPASRSRCSAWAGDGPMATLSCRSCTKSIANSKIGRASCRERV